MALPPPGAYGLGGISADPFYPEWQSRDPTILDTNFPVGKIWVNYSTDTFWGLSRFDTSSGQINAIWVPFASAGFPLQTLTGDSGGPVVPVSSDIDILGNPAEGPNGAILFTKGTAAGLLKARVVVDGTTIAINGSGQLSVVGGAFPMQCFSLQTTNAGTAETPDIPLPDDQVSQVLTNLAYIDTPATVGGASLVSGGVIVLGGVFDLTNIIDELSINEDPTLSDTNYEYITGVGASTMRVRVTGQAGFVINWRVCVSIISTP